MTNFTKWHDWTVRQVIGNGSFGTVYLIERPVKTGGVEQSALKVIRIPSNMDAYQSVRNEGLSHEEASRYFREFAEKIAGEIAIMEQFKGSRYIVNCRDHEIRQLSDGYSWKIFIRMELLTPLENWLRGRLFSIDEVIRLGIDLCNAIELCEQRHIIHRDIKPGNIFYSPEGTFKLGDFGIARQFEQSTTATAKSGTVTYMAPEVYKGLRYGTTVDLYSLGIVLYRLLNNNRTPFLPPYPHKISYSDRETANIKRFGGDPFPLPCNAPYSLAKVVMKACAYDPRDRYRCAADLRNALLAARQELSGQQILYQEMDQTVSLFPFRMMPESEYGSGSGGSSGSGSGYGPGSGDNSGFGPGGGTGGSKTGKGTGGSSGYGPGGGTGGSKKGLKALIIAAVAILAIVIIGKLITAPDPTPAPTPTPQDEQQEDGQTSDQDDGQQTYDNPDDLEGDTGDDTGNDTGSSTGTMSTEGTNAENFLNAFKAGNYSEAASWGSKNSEYAGEGCVLNMPSDMYSAYTARAKDYAESDGFSGMIGFTDFDNDGMAEMLVTTPDPEASMKLKIFKYNSGSVTEIGEIGAGHSSFYAYPDHNGIIVGYGHMGSQTYSVLHLENGNLILDNYGSAEFTDGDDYVYPGNYIMMNTIQ